MSNNKGFNSRKKPPMEPGKKENDVTPSSIEGKSTEEKPPVETNGPANEEQHKEFLKGTQETVEKKPEASSTGPVDMTPKLEKPPLGESVYESSTVENEYIAKDRGVTSGSTGTNTAPPPPPNGSTTPPPPGSTTTPPAGEFTTEPPPPGSVPEPEIKPPGDGSAPFTIPAGTAEETIQWGFEQINFLIKNFGGVITDIKFDRGFMAKLPPQLVQYLQERIASKNDSNRHVLVFSQEEIDMIKKPLAKGMAEAGIRGLTWKEELAVVCVIVFAKKGKDFREMRMENQLLRDAIQEDILRILQQAEKTAAAASGKSGDKKPPSGDGNIEDAVEVK